MTRQSYAQIPPPRDTDRPNGHSRGPTGLLRRCVVPLLLCALASPAQAVFNSGEPDFLTWMRLMALWMGLDTGSSGFYPGAQGWNRPGGWQTAWNSNYSNIPWRDPWASNEENLGSSLLDGTWRGPENLQLIIRGNRMRLWAPGGRPIEGELMVRGRYFIVYRPREDGLDVYEYLLQGNRLWLLDGNTSRQFDRQTRQP